jgi:hypothetical protein
VGRITKAGPAQARGMLVEAAFAASRTPGPLRAFYRRVKDRRGFQIATVAVARKLAVLCWHLIHRGEDYAFGRPSLTAHKRRKLELAAGATPHPGPVAGPSHDYFIKQLRDQEKTSSLKPNGPTKSSSLTGNRNDPPTLDNVIRRIYNLPDVHVVRRRDPSSALKHQRDRVAQPALPPGRALDIR